MSACPDTKDAVQIRRGHLLISSQDVSPLRVGLIVNVVGMMIEIRGLWSQHGSTGFILYQSTFTSHLDASSVAELFPVNGDQHR